MRVMQQHQIPDLLARLVVAHYDPLWLMLNGFNTAFERIRLP